MAFDVSVKFQVEGADGLRGTFDGAGAGAQQLGARLDEANARVSRAARGIVDELQSVRGMWMSLAALGGLAATAAQVIQMADSVTVLKNRLELATGSSSRAAEVYDQLFRAAQASRVSFTELGATYASIARAGGEMGVSQTRLLTVTKAIGQAMAISGGSAESMKAALVQLGQGMSSGVLRGEELNSVMEQTPRLAQAIADGLGVPIGSLRRLGEQGQLTAEAVMNALENSAPQLAREVERSTMTVGQAFTKLSNSATFFVGEADQASGASRTLAAGIDLVSRGVDALAVLIRDNQAVFGVIGGVLAGAAVITGLGALATALGTVKVALLGVLAAAGPVGIAIAAVGAALGGAAVAYQKYSESGAGIQAQIDDLKRQNDQALIALDRAKGRAQAEANIRTKIDERSAAMKELEQKLAVVTAAQAGANAEDAKFARYTADFKERERRLAELASITNKLDGVNFEHISTVKKLRDSYEAGDITLADYRKRVDQVVVSKKAADAAAKAANKTMEDEQKLLARLDGFTANFADEMRRLVSMRDRNNLSQEKYNESVQALLNKQPGVIAAHKAEQDALKAKNKVLQEADGAVDEYLDKQLEANGAAARAAEDALRKAKDEYAQYGLTKSQIAELTIVRLIDKQKAYEVGDANYASVQREIDAQRELIGVLRRGEVRDASVSAAKASADEWAKVTDQIGQGLTDSLFRAFESGRGFFDTLWGGIKNLFKTTALKLLIQPVQQGITNVIGGLLGGGGAGGALAGSGGGNGLFSQGMSLYQMGSSAYNALSGSLYGAAAAASNAAVYSGAAYGTGFGTQQSAMLAAQEAGMVSGAGASSLSMAGWAAAIIAGVYKASADYDEGFNQVGAEKAQRDIYGDKLYEFLSKSNISPEANNFKLFSALGMNEKWASILSGSTAVAKIIGRAAPRVEGRNIVGTLGGEGFTGTFDQRIVEKGGIFRSDKTYTVSEALDADIEKTLDDMAKALRSGIGEYVTALGLPVDGLARVTQAINVDVTFADAAERSKRISDAMKGYSDALFVSVGTLIEPFMRAGETVEQALQRLNSMKVFSEDLNALGGVFSDIANLGLVAKEELISFAGGMDALIAKARGFVGTYYSQDEQAGIQARTLVDEFRALGIDPASIDELADVRAIVEDAGRNLGTSEERQRLDRLLTLANQFAGVGQYLQQRSDEEGADRLTLAGLADLAPKSALLGNLLGGQAAEPATADGLATVDESVRTIGDQISGAVQKLQQSIEVGLATVVKSQNDTLRLWRDWDTGNGLQVAP